MARPAVARSGSSDAFWIARLAQGAKPVVVVTESAQDAERLRDEIAWFDSALAVHRLPDWEILPYDQFSPHPDLVSERLATLHQFSQGACDVALIPVSTALQRLAPRSYLAARTFFLRQKSRLDLAALKAQLALAGYSAVQQVMAPGEFCVRGGLIDLFPTGSAVPYRLDLLGDEIESIRTFDVDSQRSIYPVTEIRLLPAREFPMDDEGRARFRTSFREAFEGDPTKRRAYKDVSNGIAPPGVECYLPLFFEATATLFDYLPAGATCVLHEDVPAGAESFWRDLKGRWELLRGDRDRPLLAPEKLYLPAEEFFIALKDVPRLDVKRGATGPAPAAAPALDAEDLPHVGVDRRSAEPLRAFGRFVSAFDGRVLVVADGPGRRETLVQFFGEHGLHPALADDWTRFAQSFAPLMITHGPLAAGFAVPGERFAIVTEAELYPSQVRQSRRRDARGLTSAEGMLRDLAEVKDGDPVVHSQHGIGRYQGLVTMDLGEGPTEFLHLVYDGGDKLYVPVAQLHLISRYTGASPEDAPVHRLGSGQWEKARRKAAQQVRDTAAELLELYAMRAARKGFAFPLKTAGLRGLRCRLRVRGDARPGRRHPIRRLRHDRRQADGPSRVRRRGVRQDGSGHAGGIRRRCRRQAGGDPRADHAACRAAFRQLQRPLRGVAREARGTFPLPQREGDRGGGRGPRRRHGRHRDRHAQAHPEGRGVQEPRPRHHRRGAPLRRAPEGEPQAPAGRGRRAHTHRNSHPTDAGDVAGRVARLFRHRHGAAAAACDQDLRGPPVRGHRARGRASRAQARRPGYYLWNEVETIENRREVLEKLLPEARIAVAHGQMRERDLERVMRDFYHQRANLLLCSTIIETGIDVPSANTILIDRAERFGLAQLHQLRGRVGRSHHQAYAYLLTPPRTRSAPRRRSASRRSS